MKLLSHARAHLPSGGDIMYSKDLLVKSLNNAQGHCELTFQNYKVLRRKLQTIDLGILKVINKVRKNEKYE